MLRHMESKLFLSPNQPRLDKHRVIEHQDWASCDARRSYRVEVLRRFISFSYIGEGLRKSKRPKKSLKKKTILEYLPCNEDFCYTHTASAAPSCLLSILRIDNSLTATSVWATVVGAEPEDSELTLDRRRLFQLIYDTFFSNLCHNTTQKITKAKKASKLQNHARASPL